MSSRAPRHPQKVLHRSLWGCSDMRQKTDSLHRLNAMLKTHNSLACVIYKYIPVKLGGFLLVTQTCSVLQFFLLSRFFFSACLSLTLVLTAWVSRWEFLFSIFGLWVCVSCEAYLYVWMICFIPCWTLMCLHVFVCLQGDAVYIQV